MVTFFTILTYMVAGLALFAIAVPIIEYIFA